MCARRGHMDSKISNEGEAKREKKGDAAALRNTEI